MKTQNLFIILVAVSANCHPNMQHKKGLHIEPTQNKPVSTGHFGDAS